MYKHIIIIILMVFSCTTHAMDSITLTDKKAINTASKISASINNISTKVMACIDKQNGETDGCTCETRSACPFKAEFDQLINSLCAAVKEYPKWKSSIIYWETGNNLATKNMYHHYGKHCK